MKSKKLSSVLMIVFCCTISILVVWSIIAVFFNRNEPRPEIDSGEFPFRIVYEVEGEKKIIEDLIIIKYKGTDYNLDRVTPYEWNSTFASGRKKSEILNSLNLDNGLVLYEGMLENGKAYAVMINLGSNPYYMGYLSDEYVPGNILIATYDLDTKSGTRYHFTEIEESDLPSLCGFKMLETEFSKPVQ
ncbi:MAG: hypothetical protein IJD09_02970 [Clostridia bacterium]|nr:hypothetical protein [Clostridia bacterium]